MTALAGAEIPEWRELAQTPEGRPESLSWTFVMPSRALLQIAPLSDRWPCKLGGEGHEISSARC